MKLSSSLFFISLSTLLLSIHPPSSILGSKPNHHYFKSIPYDDPLWTPGRASSACLDPSHPPGNLMLFPTPREKKREKIGWRLETSFPPLNLVEYPEKRLPTVVYTRSMHNPPMNHVGPARPRLLLHGPIVHFPRPPLTRAASNLSQPYLRDRCEINGTSLKISKQAMPPNAST